MLDLRQLAEAGAHVVMAVRKTKLAHELIHEWQLERSGDFPPLNVEVHCWESLTAIRVLCYSCSCCCNE